MRGRRGPRRRRPGRHPPRAKRRPQQSAPRQLNPRLQRELKRANRLMRNGQHANAAQVFASLGERAQDRGILRPAGRLFIQAGTALLMADEVQASLKQAQKGLQLLAANERWAEFEIEGGRLVQAYRDLDRDEAADNLEKFLLEKGTGSESNDPTGEGAKEQLPSKCPYCGASLSLEQIRSGGEIATECKYCGSIVLPDEIS